MATESKQGTSQILAQGLTLTWRVPCPLPLAKPQASLPLELMNLRDAAIVAWPLAGGATTPVVRTEPLVKYIAALTVAERLQIRAEDEMAQTLHALGHVYDTLSSQKQAPADKLDMALACSRAIRLATQYYASPPWSQDMPQLLHLQCKTLQVFASLATTGTGTIARTAAKLYEESLTSLSTVNDPLCEAYLHMGEAFWRSQMLLAAAPLPLTNEEEISRTPMYIKQRFATRERHYQAAVAVMEGAARRLSSHSGLKKTMRSFSTLLERLRRECTGISNSHGAYAVSIGDYQQQQDTLAAVPLLKLAEAAENTDAILKEMEAAWFELDAELERETDAWSATSAAQSLINNNNNEKIVTPYALADIMSRLLGISQADLLNDKSLRSSSSWRKILMGALHTHRHGLQSGQWGGGLNRARDIQRVNEAIQGL